MKKQQRKERIFYDLRMAIYDLRMAIRISCGLVIGFFKAITEVAFGLASVLFFLIMLKQYQVDLTTIEPMVLNSFLLILPMAKWFILAFLIFYSYRYFKEAFE